jgi:hypothetical protein
MYAFREGRLRRSRRQAVTIAKAVPAARGRVKAQPPVVPRIDGEALRALLAGAGAQARVVEVPVNRRPWTPAGLSAREGAPVTWLSAGAGFLLRPLGIGVGGQHLLRVRVGDDAPQRSARDTFTFTAGRAGPVEVGSLFPGELREGGRIETDQLPYRAMRGGVTAVVAVWPEGTDVRETLSGLAAHDPSGLCAAEAARLADPPLPPEGWRDHPHIGPKEIYAATDGGIATDVRQDVGIICRPVDVALTRALRLRWSWRLDALPSALPEDTTLTHDYLSVALEFDDGQDLTWHWSSALPVGFSYRCPLDHWRHRETHVVARSGTADLGRWVDEERPVLADHRVAIGGPAPRRVVGAWLISVAVFQRGEGRGEFGRIELVDGDEVVRVL